MSIFAERLKDLRDRDGHTQIEVGKILGKSREAVSKYEIGEREPDLEAVVSLSKYFNVSTDYILGITDDCDLSENNKKNTIDPTLPSFDKYLSDISFIPILKLAVKIKEYNLDLKRIEEFIDNLIIELKSQKHP